MDLVNLVITQVVQSLMVPVKKHLGYLVSSTKYVKDVKEKMVELNLTEQDFQEKKRTAEANNYQVSHHVSPWLDDVKTMKEKTQSVTIGGMGCFNVAKRYKAGKQCYTILEQIKDLKERESEISWTNERKSLAKVPSTSTRVMNGTRSMFESRDAVLNDALQSLQSNNESQNMIALCGMGGVGKTTMMEQLKKVVEDLKMFDWVVKVVVGENTDLIALQRAIAEYIHIDLTETTKVARADRLCKIFEGMSQKGQKKILVIIDDIWKEVDLKDIGLTSPLPNGFKVLLTSRFEYVCTQMGVTPHSIFKVGVLNGAEAKTLFFGIVGPSLLNGDDQELEKIGEDIVKKCGGLPIAIVTIAKTLNGNIKEAWEKALQRLEKDDLKDLESITHRIFEISYENIKEDNDKAIFLLSGLFPDDFDIRIEDLLRYGWGLGFFKDVNTLTTTRRDVKICVNNLIPSNLLTESDHMGCVKMHDLVRAFVLNKVSHVKQASIINHDNKLEQDAKESCERILLKCTSMTKLPQDFNYPNLSMLILMDGDELLKLPENIYEIMEKLQVVSYENMHIPSLLLPFEHSTKLRTLSLLSCRFINDDISLLGSLSNLETLSFVDCEIRRLPSTIGKLKKLRLLDLTGCVHLRIDDGVFQNLSGLEELYMRAYNDSPIKFTKANCDELEILSHCLFALELEFFENKAKPKNMFFKNLERFKISIGCKLAEIKDDKKNLFRNTIQLVGDCNEVLDCKISELFNKTEELHLQVSEMNHLEDVLTHHSFSNITILHVSKCVDLTCLFTVDVANGFKKLEQLTISECPVLRTLVVENSRVGVLRFQKLKFVCLTSLPMFVSFWDNVIELPQMVELIVDDLPNFTSIYPHNHNTFQTQSLLNKKMVIPRLEKLNISKMENLKHIWSYETRDENNVSMLRNITVTKCDNLMNIFPSKLLPLLNHLEELYVEACGSIEVLFNMEFESVYEKPEEYNNSKLRSIKVCNLGKLKELWRIKGVNKSDIHIKCFKGVESIQIKDCSLFKNIFTPTTTKFDLRALNNYVIVNTGEKINALSKAEISEMDADIPNVTYPSYLLHACHHLRRLFLNGDNRVEEVVFEMDSDHQPLLLPYLEVIGLYYLKDMSHVWKCNWNKFIIPQYQPLQFPFQNVTDISLMHSHKIKYLLSPHMAKYVSNLKTVYIGWCDGIEEVISSRDNDENKENNTSVSSHQNTMFFPHFNTLQLRHLSCLKSIDGCDQTTSTSTSDTISSNVTNAIQNRSQSGHIIGDCWSLCQYPREINISWCDALSIIIPWYAVGQMKMLQQLKISKCNLLSYVFTFSTLESLKQLRYLKVESCNSIQVIVEEEINGTSMTKDVVVFPRLQTLALDGLPNLKGFFLGRNEFRWPLLDNVMINDCPQLMMFTSGESKTPKLKYISTRLGKHSVDCGLNFHGTINEYETNFPASSFLNRTISKGMPWSFHNLIEINIEGDDYTNLGTTIIPSNVLLQLERLEKIDLRFCHRVEEVFEVVLALEGSGLNESQSVFKIPNLTQVNLYWMNGIKYLWYSNRLIVLEFPNLTTVSILGCKELKHVFTCSMVGSLVQLQDLSISSCINLEVIVKEEDEECHAKVNLPSLKSLNLFCLSSLKGFCLGKVDFFLPLLDTLEIEYCPTVKGFTNGHLSTPQLKVIKTTFGMWYVKPDLNSFLKTKQREGYEILEREENLFNWQGS